MTDSAFAKLNAPYDAAIGERRPVAARDQPSTQNASAPLVGTALSNDAFTQAAFARINAPYDRAVACARQGAAGDASR